MHSRQTDPGDAHHDSGTLALEDVDAGREDAYWARWYRHECYSRCEFDYEDYAPAYCVGYIGYAQYGGSFADAEPWLCSNWMRIKGDSRLGLDEARLAMRAAWDRMVREAARRGARVDSVRLIRRRLKTASFKLGASLAR